MKKQKQLFKLNAYIAKKNDMPIYFEGAIYIDSAKAYKIKGSGTLAAAEKGICCVCGKELTNPLSIKLGIGPVCGEWAHLSAKDMGISNIANIRKAIVEKEIDAWFPKSMLTIVEDLTGTIEVPDPKTKVEKKERRAQLWDTEFRVAFHYDKEIVSLVKKMSGSKWNPKLKYWTIFATPQNLEILKKLNFKLIDKRTNVNSKLAQENRLNTLKKADSGSFNIPGIKRNPYPYQMDGIEFIENHGGRGLIADEMGLGKTMQALGYLQLHKEIRPAIIIVPASLKYNWESEIQATLDGSDTVEILSGKKPYKITADIIIINYDIVMAWQPYLVGCRPQIVITDESHYFKNNSAARTKAVKYIVKHSPRFIALSGTPITNRPAEFFNVLNLLDYTKFPSYFKYGKRYCNARHNGYGWDFGGASNIKELYDSINGSLMIRRKKKDVLQQLPDKQYSFIPMQLTNQKEYDRAADDIISYLATERGYDAAEKASNAEVLARIEVLKQLAVEGKMEQCFKWIDNFLAVEDKLILFATHKKTIDAIMERYDAISVKVDGSVSGKSRQLNVDRFQTDSNIKIFVGNIQAAGVGLTLTASSNVAFLEFPWTPGELMQAQDRAHRIGQKNTVTIHYLLAKGTIDQDIAEMLDAKLKVLTEVLDGKEVEASSLLTDLIKKYNETNNI